VQVRCAILNTRHKAELTFHSNIRPVQDYCEVTLGPQQNCVSQTWSLLVAGTINTLTDLLVVLLPIRTVWSLQLPTRQAIIVGLLFSFGFISCIAGSIRTYYMYVVTTSWDQTWDSYPVWITTAIELYVGMVIISKSFSYYAFVLLWIDLCLDPSNQTLLLHLLPANLRYHLFSSVKKFFSLLPTFTISSKQFRNKYPW